MSGKSCLVPKNVAIRDQLRVEHTRPYDAQMAYTYGAGYMYIMTFCYVPEREPPRTYVRTYILYENRSLIQSLALMHLPTTS